MSLSTWTPPATPALWVDEGACSGSAPVASKLTVAKVASYPNPTTNGNATLYYQIGGTGSGVTAQLVDTSSGAIVPGAKVYLKIYSVSGRLLWSTALGETDASTGEHRFSWSGKDMRDIPLANGVYFYSVTVNAADQSDTKRTPILILK